MLTDDARYKILCILATQPDISQRKLAKALGVSVGKINYCMQDLIAEGLVKATNFSKIENKYRYLYVLTPQGIDSKAWLTRRFLQQKHKEYEALREEIAQLHAELSVRDMQKRLNLKMPVNGTGDF